MSPEERDWLRSGDPGQLLSLLPASVGERKRYLFGVACCHRLCDLLIDPTHKQAIAVAEDYADGLASHDLIRETNSSAYDAWENLDVDCGPEWDPGDPVVPEHQLGIAQLKAADATQTLTLDEARGIGMSRERCCDAVGHWRGFRSAEYGEEVEAQTALLRDIFGNPFRPVVFDPRWRTEHTVGIAAKMYEDRDFTAMPILADALEEAGCDSETILSHCREPGVHVRGCWVVDLVLGKS